MRAVTRMMTEIDAAWDDITPYQLTRDAGYLADPDEERLRTICEEEGEDFEEAHKQVMSLIVNQCSIRGV